MIGTRGLEPDEHRAPAEGMAGVPDRSLGHVVNPILTIDDTTAHVAVESKQAEALQAWFITQGIACTLQRQAGVCSLDVIDFGDPSPVVEQCIREAFAEWHRRMAGN